MPNPQTKRSKKRIISDVNHASNVNGNEILSPSLDIKRSSKKAFTQHIINTQPANTKSHNQQKYHSHHNDNDSDSDSELNSDSESVNMEDSDSDVDVDDLSNDSNNEHDSENDDISDMDDSSIDDDNDSKNSKRHSKKSSQRKSIAELLAEHDNNTTLQNDHDHDNHPSSDSDSQISESEDDNEPVEQSIATARTLQHQHDQIRTQQIENQQAQRTEELAIKADIRRRRAIEDALRKQEKLMKKQAKYHRANDNDADDDTNENDTRSVSDNNRNADVNHDDLLPDNILNELTNSHSNPQKQSKADRVYAKLQQRLSTNDDEFGGGSDDEGDGDEEIGIDELMNAAKRAAKNAKKINPDESKQRKQSGLVINPNLIKSKTSFDELYDSVNRAEGGITVIVNPSTATATSASASDAVFHQIIRNNHSKQTQMHIHRDDKIHGYRYELMNGSDIHRQRKSSYNFRQIIGKPSRQFTVRRR